MEKYFNARSYMDWSPDLLRHFIQKIVNEMGLRLTVGIKGTVPTAVDLPTVDNQDGDVWMTADDGHGHIWETDTWIDVGRLQGPDGPKGEKGIDVYTKLTLPFTMPSVGQMELAHVEDHRAFAFGIIVNIETLGYFEVAGSGGSGGPHIILENLGYLANKPPGTTVPVDSMLVIVGVKGDQGDPGEGVPPGGPQGWALVKDSDSVDFATRWERMVRQGGDTMTGGLLIRPSTAGIALQISPPAGGVPLSAEGGHIHTPTDGSGLATAGNGLFYKKLGTGLVLRCASGNQQPQIENNDGGGIRQILDTNNGVRKTGDGMTGDLSLSNNARLYVHGPNANNTTVRVLEAYAGGTLGSLQFIRTGWFISAEAHVELHHSAGGYGYRRAWRASYGGGGGDAPLLYCDGDVNAQMFVQRSDIRLKTDIEDVDPEEAATIFRMIRPVKFRYPPPEVLRENAPDPALMHFGMLAQDIDGTGLVSVDEDGMLGYSVTGVQTILVSKVAQLEKQVTKQQQQIEELTATVERLQKQTKDVKVVEDRGLQKVNVVDTETISKLVGPIIAGIVKGFQNQSETKSSSESDKKKATLEALLKLIE